MDEEGQGAEKAGDEGVLGDISINDAGEETVTCRGNEENEESEGSSEDCAVLLENRVDGEQDSRGCDQELKYQTDKSEDDRDFLDLCAPDILVMNFS